VTIIGLDLGRKKIGVALSSGIVAEGYTTLKFDEHDIDHFISELNKIIFEQKVDKIVVGLPLGRDGKETNQSIWAKTQAQKIASATGKQVVFVEESYSSSQAEGERGDIDQQSARIILEQYLNETNNHSL